IITERLDTEKTTPNCFSKFSNMNVISERAANCTITPPVKAIKMDRNIPEIMETVLSMLMYFITSPIDSFFSTAKRIPMIIDAPNNSKTMETVVEVGRPNELRSEEHTSELQSRENLVCRL